MVRVWHPDIVGWLDDNRITAAHAETHYILGALFRGGSAWWLHPETQKFYQRESSLRYCHMRAAQEMIRRGSNHQTPMIGPKIDPRDPFDNEKSRPWSREELREWRERDLADLYRKWDDEGRITTSIHDGSLTVELGAVIMKPSDNSGLQRPRGHAKSGKPIYGFKPAKTQFTLSEDDVILMGDMSVKHPARFWTKADSAAHKAMVLAEGRGPSTDVHTQVLFTPGLVY